MRVRGRELHSAEHSQHYACFWCRKAFKQRGSRHPSQFWIEAPDRPFPCPDCKTPMVPLGRDFKAPPQRAKAEWLTIELLQSFGIIFEVPVVETGGPGPRPTKLSDAVEFLTGRGLDSVEVRRRVDSIRRQRSGEGASGATDPSSEASAE